MDKRLLTAEKRRGVSEKLVTSYTLRLLQVFPRLQPPMFDMGERFITSVPTPKLKIPLLDLNSYVGYPVIQRALRESLNGDPQSILYNRNGYLNFSHPNFPVKENSRYLTFKTPYSKWGKIQPSQRMGQTFSKDEVVCGYLVLFTHGGKLFLKQGITGSGSKRKLGKRYPQPKYKLICFTRYGVSSPEDYSRVYQMEQEWLARSKKLVPTDEDLDPNFKVGTSKTNLREVRCFCPLAVKLHQEIFC